MKKRVAKMMDDTIDEVVASRGILLAKEETRFLDQLEEVFFCPTRLLTRTTTRPAASLPSLTASPKGHARSQQDAPITGSWPTQRP
jgi:hypothetical protein